MALRFLDSFDHYTAAQASTKWTSASALRAPGLHGYGMSGTFSKGMRFPTNTIIMEAYILRSGGGGGTIFTVLDTDPAGHAMVWLTQGQDGALSAFRGGSILLAQSVPDLIRVGVWTHVGWRTLVHPTAGAVEVRVNGGTVINITGVNTTSTISFSGTVGAFVLSGLVTFDDLVVMDDVADGIADPRLPGGGGFTQFLGPVIIKVKRPNGAGDLAGWTGLPTTPNWDNVNDPESDVEATYNGATVAQTGASDLFAMENLLPGEDVLAVQSLVLARKTDDGIAAIAKLVQNGGTTSQGATVYQPNSYSYMHAPEPTLPDGSLWTAAKWNAIQYGYKRIV